MHSLCSRGSLKSRPLKNCMCKMPCFCVSLYWASVCTKCRWKVCTVVLRFHHLMGRLEIRFVSQSRQNISTQTDSWRHLQSWVNREMEMDQLFHCELGDSAQTLHESSAAEAQTNCSIMQKPGPSMLCSRHAEWYAVAGHRCDGRERKEGSNPLASQLYLNCEQYLGRRKRGRDSKTKEVKER